MEQIRQDQVACDYCGKELENFAWVEICSDGTRTHCESCAWRTQYTGCVLMRGFKTLADYIEHLFGGWFADRFAGSSEE
jgi:hypothetical protein